MRRQARKSRPTTTAQKLTAVGLASATCVGLVGLLAVRNAEDASAADEVALTASTDANTPSTALTQQQLDDYSAQLAAEQAKSDAYRQQLADQAEAAKKKSRAAAKAAVAAQQRLLEQQLQARQQQQLLMQQYQQQSARQQGKTHASR